MLDYFIVTLWLEMHGKLYQKQYLPLQTDCARAKVEIVKQFEKIKSASQGDIPLFTVTMQLDKTGELELSGEGAFVSVGKEYVKSMREVVRGVKTFTNATRKFRS